MKLFKKLTTLVAGLTMALGIGLVADHGARAARVEAESQKYTVSFKGTTTSGFASDPTGWTATGCTNYGGYVGMTSSTSTISKATDVFVIGGTPKVLEANKTINFLLELATYGSSSAKADVTVSLINSSGTAVATSGPVNIAPTSSSAGKTYGVAVQTPATADTISGVKIQIPGTSNPFLRFYSVEFTYEYVALEPEVQNVIDLINAIGTVSLESEAAIIDAEEAYVALSGEQQALVSNYPVLTAAREAYDLLVEQENNATTIANTFMAKVDAMHAKTIVAGDASEIAALEAEYATYSGTAKSLIDGAGYAAKIANIKQRLETALDLAAAQVVIDLISNLPATASIVLEDADEIVAAREAYDALNATQKGLVSNYSVLLAAEVRMGELDPSSTATQVYAMDCSGTKEGTFQVSTTSTGQYVANFTANSKTSADYKWILSAGQVNTTAGNGPVGLWLGSNNNSLKQTLNDYSEIQDALTAAGETAVRSSAMVMNSFYINKPTEFTIGWDGVAAGSNHVARIRILASIDNGDTYNILKTSEDFVAAENNAVAGSMTWKGLNYINTKYVKFAVVISTSRPSNDTTAAAIRNVKTNIKALDTVIPTEFISDQEVDVTGITINPTELALDVGEQHTVTVGIEPLSATNKNYTLESSDEDVVTVTSAGVVAAVGEGTATVTAISTANSSITATCAVTVSEPSMVYTPTGAPTAENKMLQMGNTQFVQKVSGHSYVGFPTGYGAQYGTGTSSGIVEFETSLVMFAKQDLDKIVVGMATSAAAGIATLKVYLGAEQIGSTITLTRTATEYTFVPTGTSTASHLRIVAEGNGICLQTVKLYGGVANIAAGRSGAMKTVYDTLMNANPCEDYGNWQAMQTALQALTAKEQEMVRSALYVSAGKTVETLGDKFDYMKGLALAGGPQEAPGSNPLSELGRNPQAMISILVIIVGLGLTAIVGYYFILKRKHIAE